MKKTLIVVLCGIMLLFSLKIDAAAENIDNVDDSVNTEAEAGVIKPSEAKLIYDLDDPFYGDGNSSYVDTEIKLYDGSMDQWIVMAYISNDLGEGDNVFFSCFSESEPYRGLILRNPTGSSYEFICGMQGQQWIYQENAKYFAVAIQRDENNYRLFFNGAVIYELTSEEVIDYDGTLLLGCEEDEHGAKFRFGNVDIASLRVYQGTQSPSITASQMEDMVENSQVASDEAKKAVLKDRSQEEENGFLQSVIELMQENGIVLFVLVVGFAIACMIVYILDRHKKHGEEK